MDWSKFAYNNNVETISDYISDIDPSIIDIYDMMTKVPKDVRDLLLRTGIDKILVASYRLGYISRPDIKYINGYLIELIPEEEARKIKPTNYYDAIVCYKRGFIDMVQNMTLDGNIMFNSNNEDDKYILEILKIRLDWIPKVINRNIGNNYGKLLMLYPQLLSSDSKRERHALPSSEIIDVIERSGKVREGWIVDILMDYLDMEVITFALDNDIYLNYARMFQYEDDDKIMELIELDNSIGFLENDTIVFLYLNTGRSIFLNFRGKRINQLVYDYSKKALRRSLKIDTMNKMKIDIIFNIRGINGSELTDSDIRLIYNRKYTIDISKDVDLSVIVRLLDYLPLDMIVGEDNIQTIPDESIIELHKKYPLGVRKLWELYSVHDTKSMDIMAYYLPINITERFKPSVRQLNIFNYLKVDKQVKIVYSDDITLKLI